MMGDLFLSALLIALAVVAGRVWVLLPSRAARMGAWAALAGGVICLSFLERPPLLRMAVFCTFLLGAMKALVYVEWAATGRRLTWGRYLIFSFLWFGMEPGTFARRRMGLEWRSHLRIGMMCASAGLLGALIVRSAGWPHVLLLFVPMSLAFHYGALRLMTAGFRLGGLRAQVLFRNPFMSTGLGDFWAVRWNTGYAHMMARTVLRPARHVVGSRLAQFMVFVFSGLLHEIAITVPVRSGYGLPTLYFLIQGLAVEVENHLIPRKLRRPWALASVLFPIGLLFPPAFREECIVRVLSVLPDLFP